MRIHPIDGLLSITMRLLYSLSKRPAALTELDPDKIKRIIVVSSTAIGDFLISSPAIRALRERYPNASITGHIHRNYITLFENNPYIDDVIPYNGGYRNFFSTVMAMRSKKPDAVVILHGNGPQAIPMAWLSGAPFVVRIPNRSEYRYLLSNSAESPANACNPEEHGIQDRLRIAGLLDATSDNKEMVLVVEDKERQEVDRYFKDKNADNASPLIGFQVAASTVSRMWMKDRFAQLGQQLLENDPQMKLIITGSPQERTYCEEVAEMIDNPRVLVTAGELSLPQVPAMLETLDLLVTGDTGVMHMAIAVKTPTVALFAVADPRKSAACYDEYKHLVIYKGKTCDPCPGKKCPYPKCMEQIEVQEVFDAVTQLLNNRSNS